MIPDHLVRKAKLKEGGEGWLGNVQVHLETFETFFGAERDLADIELREMENYRAHLSQARLAVGDITGAREAAERAVPALENAFGPASARAARARAVRDSLAAPRR